MAKDDDTPDSNGQDGLAEGPEGDKPMAFLDHVGELRQRLIRIVLGVVVGFFSCFYFAPQISDFLRIPLDDAWEKTGFGRQVLIDFVEPEDGEGGSEKAIAAFVESLEKRDAVLEEYSEEDHLWRVRAAPEVLDELEREIEERTLDEDELALIEGVESSYMGKADLQALAIQDPLMVDVRVALTAGIFLTAPWLFFQVWLFVAPGLYNREKKFAIPFVLVSVLMFVAGAAFAFEIVLPFIYQWMMDYSSGRGEVIQLELNNYFKGTTRVLLAFGLVFEFPLAVAFLAKAGVVTEKTLLRYWKIAVLIMFVLAAVLTPPEPVSQLMMAGPMVVLYFISVGVARIINPAHKVEAALAEFDDEDDDDAGDADDSD